MRWHWLFIVIVLFGGWHHWNTRPVSRDAGVLVRSIPLQDGVEQAPPLARGDYRITPLQSFTLQGRVLAAAHYRWDREAELAPVDLALGWGPMSDQMVLKDISITQSGRFYHWRVSEFRIPRREIETHSANMHMIPSTDEIEHKLKKVRVGQLVKVEGYLVEVRGADGWSWRSSLTRDDTGAGACELIWVANFESI